MLQIDFNNVARADLLRLDKRVRERILKFLEECVANHPAPMQIAEPLEGAFKGLHRFRVGDYRVVCHIWQRRLTVLILFIDHRSTIYQRRSLPSGFDLKEDES